MFGRLTLEAFKHDWIENGANFSMIFGAILLAVFITYKKKWMWIWKEWVTSVDHKKVGVMYIAVSSVMLFKGVVDAVMMRAQQAMACGEVTGYLTPDHYQQIFTAHGVTMIFFVGMGLVFGLINLVLPLQIGARDVAFPYLNSLSFWLFASGSLFILVSLMIGNFAGTGWSAYPPLSGIEYNPGVGVDYWLWSIQISGAGSLLSGINFLVTIIKMRCPGMTWMKMPVFVWATFATMILVVFAFPILTATTAMLTTDRILLTKIFTADSGGNPMMYINLFWAWGHPEVYILILPLFGVFSEIVPVFSQKKLFGYTSMVYAIAGIAFLAFVVWLHHFFTMGAGPAVNTFFGIMTMVIALPTGVKVFNWLFTMFRGRIKFTTPMYWFLGFITTFTVGGAAGILMSIPAADFQVHNSLFLIAHFHFVIIGGVVFGFFAAYSYWFPKFTGFRLDEKTGKYAFWFWLIGFLLAFSPLYLLGLMGATRRLEHYDDPSFQPLFIIAFIGAVILFIGLNLQVLQLFISIKNKEALKDTTGDPWNGRTLEWSTTSPPPFYNFAHTPHVKERDDFWITKHTRYQEEKIPYHKIHMPCNTGHGFVIGQLSFLLGFGMIWQMYWLAILASILIVATSIHRLSQKHVDYDLSEKIIESIENKGSL